MEEGARQIVRLQRLIVTMDKPVVVEVAGPVRAGGIGIVAAADIALAAEEATFALTEVKLGLAAAIVWGNDDVVRSKSERGVEDPFLGHEDAPRVPVSEPRIQLAQGTVVHKGEVVVERASLLLQQPGEIPGSPSSSDH